MSRLQIEALLAESGDGLDAVDRAHVGDELGALLGLVDDAPPPPSPALQALLAADASAAGPTRLADRRLTGARGAVTGAVVLAVATVGATGLSAAANSLPAPLQRHAADLSRTYLPFDFPRPRAELDHDLGLGLAQPERLGTVAGDAAEQDARVPLSPLSPRPEARPPAATTPATDDVRRDSTPATDVPRPERSSDPTSGRSTPSTGRPRTDASADVGDPPDRRDGSGDAARSRGDRGGSPRPGASTASSPSSPSTGEPAQQPLGLVVRSPRPGAASTSPLSEPLSEPLADPPEDQPGTRATPQEGQGQGKSQDKDGDVRGGGQGKGGKTATKDAAKDAATEAAGAPGVG